MELHVIEREGRKTVVLLDNEMRIVKPVYDYLKFQRQKDKALNTLKASGSDLRTYWEFLNDNGYEYDNCTDGDGCFFYNCPNYITEVQFYPILKDELDLLEKEMVRLKELGQEPAYQVQAVKYKYLKPLVESLEVQLNGKESVG